LKAEVIMSHSWRIVCAGLLACSLATGAKGQEENPQTIEGWGTVTDLLGDCTVKADGQKLSVRVPGGTHDLNQVLGGLSAPRILQSVDGDFAVEVKVTSDFEPGRESVAGNTRPFNSAGLLVWQDEKNYIRLERNRYWVIEANDYVCYPPLVEHYRNGVYQESNPQPEWASFFEGKSTWLRLERKGKVVTASYSHDGKKWTQAKQLKTDLAKQLQVGVVVVNTSAKELAVDFEGLKISSKSKTE
jgi:regulation of enolase protein 1 (concanavalin A-like superfamily)